MFQTDRNELGDRRLNVEEGVIKLRELCLKDAGKFRVADQDELTDTERSDGARIPHTALLTRLQKIIPGLHAKNGSPGNLALYYARTTKQLYEKLQEGGTTDEFFIFNRYVGGFPKEELPEWGYLDVDTSLLVTREHIRGWRTVLIGLMHAGILSYADATKEFGDPATDQRNTVWMKKTLEWRENPKGKFTLQDYLEARKQ